MRVKPNGILNKVSLGSVGAGVGSALVVLIVWLLSLAGVDMPLYVQAALVVIVTALGSLIAGYLTPIAAGEVQITGRQPPMQVQTPVVHVTETER
jgi:hypothetical protein